MYKIFIDGSEGTTGLRLKDRLQSRDDIELIGIPDEKRKVLQTRMAAILESDISFLCLPDSGSKEIVNAIMAEISIYGAKSPFNNVRLIDCSTAHRTYANWAYGLPELAGTNEQEVSLSYINLVRSHSKLVAVPGCHATGYLLSVRPLVNAELLKNGSTIAFHSITGYSGGGKKMISAYEQELHSDGDDNANFLGAPRQYGLTQLHKHLPEMMKYSGIGKEPIFSPIVANYYSGMIVSVPIALDGLREKVDAEYIHRIFSDYYRGFSLIHVRPLGFDPEAGYLSAYGMSGRDDLEIMIEGTGDRINIITRYDNLGKGASGAAIQCMNIMLGLPDTMSLVTEQ